MKLIPLTLLICSTEVLVTGGPASLTINLSSNDDSSTSPTTKSLGTIYVLGTDRYCTYVLDTNEQVTEVMGIMVVAGGKTVHRVRGYP